MFTESELRNLRQAIESAQREATEARAAAEKLVTEQRAAGTNPLTDKDAFTAVDDAYKVVSVASEKAVALRERLATALGMNTDPREEERQERREDVRKGTSAADNLVAHRNYKGLIESGSLDSMAAHVNLSPTPVLDRSATLSMLRPRATVDASELVEPDATYFPPLLIPQRRIRLLDVIEVGSTDSDTVSWVEETTHTNAAAPTAYGTAAPEATYVYGPKSTTVRRIPHSVPATKGNLMDRGQLATLLGSNLANGVRRITEAQCLAGAGTGENFEGILTVTGTHALTKGTDTVLDAIHKAITTVNVALLDQGNAAFVMMHPTDFETIRLVKDSTGSYLMGHPMAADTPVAWGLPIVVSPLITANTVLVGDGSWATLYVRQGVTVAASDSHADFFTKGLVMFVAESRAAFAVRRPAAFAKLNLAA